MYRRGLILGLGVIALLMGFAATSARADGKRVALVVGNSAYRNVPELPIRRMTPAMSPLLSIASAFR
jgi:hypothetical protein